jgi:hypothetical protein
VTAHLIVRGMRTVSGLGRPTSVFYASPHTSEHEDLILNENLFQLGCGLRVHEESGRVTERSTSSLRLKGRMSATASGMRLSTIFPFPRAANRFKGRRGGSQNGEKNTPSAPKQICTCLWEIHRVKATPRSKQNRSNDEGAILLVGTDLSTAR